MIETIKITENQIYFLYPMDRGILRLWLSTGGVYPILYSADPSC